MSKNFDKIHPRTITSTPKAYFEDKITKTGDISSTAVGYSGGISNLDSSSAGLNNVFRNPSRRFYDPQFTATSIYLPRTLRERNRWLRWFYDHDEIIGSVLDLHAEIPHSQAEFIVDDPIIQKQIEDAVDRVNLFAWLPSIDLEFQKIGEVFIHTPWNDSLGMYDDIIIHNPDFIEVAFSPFAERESSIELMPSDELKKLIHSTRPEDQQLKKRIPKNIFNRVLNGKNIILNPDEITHIARKSNPYDDRGKSILERLFRTLILDDKYRESQISIADNFIYPLKIFKLGDPQRGWIPDKSQQESLAQMLSQANMDPNFALIYHYALQVDYVTVADKLLRLDNEWTQIDKRKMAALGVSEQFISGSATYACHPFDFRVTTPTGFEKIQNLKIGDLVLDKDGYPKKVIDNWDEGIPESITEITLWNGRKIKATDNHKMPAWIWNRKCVCGCGKDINTGRTFAHSPRWYKDVELKSLPFTKTIKQKYCKGFPVNYEPIQKVRADELQRYDFLMIPRKFKEITPDCDLKQAKLLGYFIAEGNYLKYTGNDKKRGLCFTFNVTEENTLVKDCVDLCNKIGLCVSSIGRKKESGLSIRTTTVDQVQHVSIIDWFFKHAGEYSGQKKLSQEVMQWPLEYKKELIKGMFLGDGCHQVNKNNNQITVSYTTTSEVLIYQLELIMAQLGFSGSYVHQVDKRENRQDTYRLDFFGKTAYELGNMIWEEDFTYKDINPDKFISQKYWVDENYIYVEIRDVKKISNTKKVYNLTVEDTHSYLVDNIGTYNSANVGLQTQLARYKAKRDLFEIKWLRDKFFRVLAEKNEWYKRDKREIVGQYRIKRSKEELKNRLILPKIVWHKKLMMRDDQSFLNFLNNVYASGKGPISTITLLMNMGLSLEDELNYKKKVREYEDRIGEFVHPPISKEARSNSTTKTGGWFDFLKGDKKEASNLSEEEQKILEELKEIPSGFLEGEMSKAKTEITGSQANDITYINIEDKLQQEEELTLDTSKAIKLLDDSVWYEKIQSENLPPELIMLITPFIQKLDNINKKYDDFKSGIETEKEELLGILNKVYNQGKLFSYTNINSKVPYNYNNTLQISDYSDLLLYSQFEDWLTTLLNIDYEDSNQMLYKIRDLSNNCFAYGQLKGITEQGIENVKIFNVPSKDGLIYKVNDLLSKELNLNSIVSPESDFIVFIPCIEGYNYEDIDKYIEPSSDFTYNSISIENCPIEYKNLLINFINKFSGIIKNKYTKIAFVEDVTQLSEWSEDFVNKFKQANNNNNNNIDGLSYVNKLQNELSIERQKRAGVQPVFIKEKTAYISKWFLTQENLFTDNLIKYLNLEKDINKIVEANFKNISFNLTKDEIDTYAALEFIDKVSNNLGEQFGWIYNTKNATNDFRLKEGKMWDINGKCTNKVLKDKNQIFTENVKKWLYYSHSLNEELKQNFNHFRG